MIADFIVSLVQNTVSTDFIGYEFSVFYRNAYTVFHSVIVPNGHFDFATVRIIVISGRFGYCIRIIFQRGRHVFRVFVVYAQSRFRIIYEHVVTQIAQSVNFGNANRSRGTCVIVSINRQTSFSGRKTRPCILKYR